MANTHIHGGISKAVKDNEKLEEILGHHSKLMILLNDTAAAASCRVDMILLPVLTAASGLMNTSVATTHRTDIVFEEPNVIWSCVAATPGM